MNNVYKGNEITLGRQTITTSYVTEMMRSNGAYVPEEMMLNDTNIIDLLQTSFTIHAQNAKESDKLINYFLGKQPILDRKKDLRKEIDNRNVINYAYSTTRTINGYTFGTPVTYKAKDLDDNDDVVTLNEYMEQLDKASIDLDKGEMASITGTSYISCLASKSVVGADDEIPFILNNLDPRTTFVVYSSANPKVAVMAVTYYYINDMVNGNAVKKAIVNVYTREYVRIYKVACSTTTSDYDIGDIQPEDLISKDSNMLCEIPIIEYPNNQWRLGDWEMVTGIFNAINNVVSDNVNDIQQFVNSILVITNGDLPEKTVQDPLDPSKTVTIKDTSVLNAGILLLNNDNGSQSDAKYIAKQLDSAGANLLRNYLDQAYKIIVGIPDRKTNSDSGGDTGEAVSKRDGWQDLSLVADAKEKKYKESENKLLKLILKILNLVQKPLNIKTSDLLIVCARNMTDNLLTKAQAISTLKQTNMFSDADIIGLGQITNDENAMAERGRQFQEQAFKQGLERQKELSKLSKNDENGEESDKNDKSIDNNEDKK